MTQPIPVIMPFVDLWHEYTEQAAQDVLCQSTPTQLLLFDNGSGREDHDAALVYSATAREFHSEAIELFTPPTPIELGRLWNTALDIAWHLGAYKALVVNNDVRLHPRTLEFLVAAMQASSALFVSAVGVREEQFSMDLDLGAAIHGQGKGGPDFSCFLISRECHEKYRFDENLIYYSDNDYHYRMKLGGDTERIFSINLPYLHYGSRTINRSPEAHEAGQKRFEEHRDYYIRKWGGVGGQETFKEAFDGKG